VKSSKSLALARKPLPAELALAMPCSAPSSIFHSPPPILVQPLSDLPSQVGDADVAPAHLEGHGAGVLVHLEADEAGQIERVHQVGAGHAVDEGPDAVADGLDAETIPLVVLERLARRRVFLDAGDPTAARFVEDAARIAGTFVRDLELAAVDAARRLFAQPPALVVDQRLGLPGILVASNSRMKSP
jgi:hypothetical protein